MLGEHDDPEICLYSQKERQPSRAHFTIILDYDVHQQMKSYARTDLTRELAGVLLGHYSQKDSQIQVIAAIEARDAERQRTSVKFTHESWDYINQVKDKAFPDLKVVGWFHTHPGFGIFLSRFDLFIQRNFFNLPWQVAIVLDPVTQKEGFFCWEGNEIRECPYVVEKLGYNNGGYLLPGSCSNTASPKPEEEPKHADMPGKTEVTTEVTSSGRRFKWWQAVAVLVIVMGLALGSLGGYNLGIRHGQALHEDSPVSGSGITVPSPTVVEVESPGEVIYKHKVRKGDNLWLISELYYGTGFRYEEIMRYNDLDSGQSIRPGQVLIVPNVEEGKP